MSEVYVHNNPGSVRFNTFIYAFLRSWYTHDGVQDRWYKIAAFRDSSPDPNYVCLNANVENVAVMVIAEGGIVLKSHNTKLRQRHTVDSITLASIQQECFDIPAWEYSNQQSFDYSVMFEATEIRRRYRTRFGTDKPVYDRILDQNYRNIKRTITPPARCGSCGGKRRS